jgi:hypothetical protein
MRSCALGFVITSLIMLASCGPRATPLPQVQDICAPKSVVSETADMAPPYPEIRNAMDQLYDGTPGLSKDEISIASALDDLVGKRVVNWCAWVSSVSPTEEVITAVESRDQEQYAGDFRLYVSMQEPDEAHPDYDLIRILGLTRAQAEMFPSWHTSPTPQPAGQKVVFSGTILSIINYDELEVLLSDLAVIE